MKKIIGLNAVLELIKTNTSNIQKIEMFHKLESEKANLIKVNSKKNKIKLEYSKDKIENSQGVVAYLSDYDYYMELNEFIEHSVKKEKEIVLILDNVQDPRNFGALIRSAEIFGVKTIIIPERKSVPVNESVVKTSTGAIEHVKIIKVQNISDAIKQLKKVDFWVYGADGEGKMRYYDEKYPNKTAIVLGSEGFGIRKKVKENCDILVSIPMYGEINSLNVSVAGGIILSEISKRHNNIPPR